MRRRWLVTLAAIVTLHVAIGDEGQSHYERRVDRVTASPGPVAGAGVLSDMSVYLVNLSAGAAAPGTVVQADASSAVTTPFFLRYHRPADPPQGALLPSSQQSLLLPGPGLWYVEVDPAAGVDVHIVAVFRGFVGDPDGGAPAAFALGDVEIDRACVQPGACLP